MTQQMGGRAPHVARLPPQPRLGTAEGRSLRSGHDHRLLRTSGARLGMVTRLDAAAITVCKNSRRLDQHYCQAVSKPNPLDSVRFSSRKGDKFLEVEMAARDDDLDVYGVVNNAVYASYITRARDILLEKFGISVENLTATGKAMALSELNLKFFVPLRVGERFVVKTRPVQIKGVRLVIHHVIERLPDHELVLDAKGTAVFLDKDYRPTRVFPEVSAKIWELFGLRAL